MRLTKFEHACFSLEKEGDVLLVDPGDYTTDFTTPKRVVGVIITHEHADHFSSEQIKKILAINPDSLIVGPAELANKTTAFTMKAAKPGETLKIGSFIVQFFGGKHALIHPSIPAAENLAILIDETLYYPGDSLVAPPVPVDVLAIPATAPWLKIGEAMDFLAVVRPRFAFPTHDAIATESGKQLIDRLLGSVAQTHGIEYQRIMTIEL